MRYIKTIQWLMLYLTSFQLHPTLHGEKLFIELLGTYLEVNPLTKQQMNEQATATNGSSKQHIFHKIERPFFRTFPSIKKNIPLIELANLPTPIIKAKKLSAQFKSATIYIKRDDMSGKLLNDGTHLFGGNKMRILEIEMARALQEGAETILTMGCDGSNLVTAVAASSHFLGLQMKGVIKQQPNAHVVQRNLLLMDYYGAQLTGSSSTQNRAQNVIALFNKIKEDTGRFPYFIPVGASTPFGAIGFINAAFELKDQIKEKLMPEPDRIYIAAGQTVGTYVGLLIGARLVGLKSKIIAVAVEPDNNGTLYAQTIKSLFTKTIHMLHDIDQTFPLLKFNEKDVEVIHTACGKRYALFTQESAQAIQLLKTTEQIELDGVYSGKAMAALLHDIKTTIKPNENILFWNTFCGGNFSSLIAKRNYKNLPHELHHYFETKVQEFDII